MSTNFEKYLRGEPLNEENARIRRGELPEGIDPAALPGRHLSYNFEDRERAPLTGAERPLRPDERAALREMRQGPGWAVLQRLLERATLRHTNAAILLSQDDPAGKSAELTNLWLTVKMWKSMVAQLNLMVGLELMQQEQEAHGRDETEPAEQGA